jgi:hypothetical protein
MCEVREVRCQYRVLRNRTKQNKSREVQAETTKSKIAERSHKPNKRDKPQQNSQTENHRRNRTTPTPPHQRLKPGHRQPSHRLVDVDVKADGAGVEVLEVVETGVANGLHLDGDGLASAAGSLVDVVRVAGRHLLGAEHLVGLGLGLVSGALGAGRLQDAELDLAGAGH